jgi:hypothetical protein
MDGLRRTRGARRAGGLTLIEVLIALGILAGGLLTAAAAQLYAMKGGSSGRHGSDAAAIAQAQLENFQRIAFPNLAPTGGWDPPGGAQVDTVVQADPVNQVEMSYAVQWRIADLAPCLKAIDVRVTWNEPQRPNRSVVASTIRHDDPPTASEEGSSCD